jgi:hypothetical protein
MTKRQFVLVVVDRDTGEFTVEGPMSDDRLWNSAVVNAQRVGRNIRCFSIGDIAPDVAATEWHSSYGGLQDCVWLDRVGALSGAALTKAPVRRPPGPHASIGTVNTARKWPLSAARRPLMRRRCHNSTISRTFA